MHVCAHICIHARIYARLRLFLSNCDHLGRLQWVHSWVQGNLLLRLEAADTQLQQAINTQEAQATLPQAYGTWMAAQASSEGRKHKSLSWQAVATQIVRPASLQPIHMHFRRRLDGFRMRTLPGYRVARAVGILQRLSRLVAPRVTAAYIRTICNGWCTHARFQGHGACRLGCGNDCDSIEHVARCPLALEWSRRYARLQRPPQGGSWIFLLHDRGDVRHGFTR